MNPKIVKDVTFLFLLALLVRIGYAFFFVESAYLITEDQMGYIQLAQQLPDSGFLGLNLERVPGYPLFLAIINNIFGDNIWNLIAVQIVLDSLSCVMIGLLAQTIFLKGFWIAGVISVFNLNMIILSASLLTDTLFLFIFILSIFSIVRYLQREHIYWLISSIVLLSIATMVRSASYYLLPILLLSLTIWRFWRKDSIVQVGRMIVLYLLIVATILGGIHHRNYTQYQSTALVSHTGSHLLNWVVPATYQYSGQGSYKEGYAISRERLRFSLSRDKLKTLPSNQFESSAYQARVGKEILLEFGVVNIVKAWIVGSIINLLAPSLSYAPVVRSIKHPSFYETAGSGAVEKLWNYTQNSSTWLYLLILAVGTIVSALFLFLALAGVAKVVKAIKNGKEGNIYPVIIIVLLILVGYFLAITGPIIGVKYRLPLEPILTLFVTYFLIGVRPKFLPQLRFIPFLRVKK